MSDWSVIEAARMSWEGGTGTYGGTITTGAANTKGSWLELEASTPFDARGILVQIMPQNATKYLIDIGVGSSTNERPIVENIMVQEGLSDWATVAFYLPVRIAASQRLVVRGQAAAASQTAIISIVLLDCAFPGPPLIGEAVTYGAETADSSGIQLDPGATANTKGAWSEIVASTTGLRWLVLLVGDQANTANTTQDHRIDVGVGALGSERVLIPDLLRATSAQETAAPHVYSFPFSIDDGQRLVARCQSSITTAGDRLIDVEVIGVR